ncbi:5'-deoxynucleotidase [Paenibacillus oenotherae]|uniref:5'-deoxynucleotidase n=1 Tax=Paenibacillus oenotherae TaxID=1435645 RepID=A0ABS7D3U6_9BACL|nr:5'-deoxynucleotidase [Paenibacillus oenotherae]
MYRLRYIERWSLMRNTTRENVAEHSYHVALLAHMLCEIGNHIYGRSLNADRAVTMALFHDATEVFTGDIPTPVKHHNPKMLSAFREIESLAAERLLGMVPQQLHDVYAPLIGGHGDASGNRGAAAGTGLAAAAGGAMASDYELHKILKAADLLDAYIKCLTELSSGNREFAVAKGQTENKLALLAMPEVDWFLSHMAPSFSMTLDELSRED